MLKFLQKKFLQEKFLQEKSIARKIIFITITCFVIASLAIGYVVFNILQNVSLKQLEEFTTSSFEYFVEQIDHEFNAIFGLTDNIATDIKKIYLGDTVANTADLLHNAGRYFISAGDHGIISVTAVFENETDEQLSNFENLILAGSFRHTTFDSESYKYKNFVNSDCYLQAKQTLKCVWAEPAELLSDDEKKIVTRCVCPMFKFDNETDTYIFIGVVAITVDLAYFDNLVEDYRLGSDSYNLLTSSTGVFVSHPIPSYMEAKNHNAFLSDTVTESKNTNAILAAISANRDDKKLYRLRNSEMLAAINSKKDYVKQSYIKNKNNIRRNDSNPVDTDTVDINNDTVDVDNDTNIADNDTDNISVAIDIYKNIYSADKSQKTDNTDEDKSAFYRISPFQIDSIGGFACHNSIVFCKPVATNDWLVFTVFPSSIFQYILAEFQDSLFWSLFIIACIFFIFASLFINNITKPLRYINNSINTFDDINIEDWEMPNIETKDEAHNISKSFNILVSTLQATQNRLMDVSAELASTRQNFEEQLERKTISIEEQATRLIESNHKFNMELDNIYSLNELGMLITGTLSLEKISFAVFDKMRELIPINSFAIFTFNEKTNSLDCNYGVVDGEKMNFFRLPASEPSTMIVKCFETRKEIIINNIEVEYQNHLLMKPVNIFNKEMGAMYFNSIIDGDNILGVFTIQSVYKGIWAKFDFSIFKVLKTYLDASIKNIMSYENLQKSIVDLNAAQAKLVETEKMASLGQLTAGIAHEIKNPLNFVINFSELSKTLINDLQEEISKLNDNEDITVDLDDIDDLVKDIELNISKISEHSKRADNIMKNMLQHSRGRTGEFTLTDINSLVREFAQLSYHGMRATDSTFGVKMVYMFDESIGMVNVVPHNISRVIINTVNNACFAAHEQSKRLGKQSNFTPTVTVKTTDLGDKLSIVVIDNGIGISADNKSKIFSPFFTTKVTGQGTGLGLSISYEIIIEEHKGEFSFDSKENEFTEFKIILPKKLNL